MPSEVRFSRAQKWDLMRMSAAAVASTVFFTVPLFLVRTNSTPQPTTAQSPTTTGASTVAAASMATPPAPPAESARPAIADTVAVVTSTEFAVESTPVLQPNRAQSVRGRTQAQPSAVLRAQANVKRDPAQPSFKRRLARFFSGVGKYAVKPFPTVTNSGN